MHIVRTEEVPKYVFNPEIEVLLPRDILLDDGSRIIVPKEEIEKTAPEHVFELWVPEDKVDEIAKELRKHGFKDVTLSRSFGEKYSLSLEIFEPWELHVRIFDDGRIISEIEVSRKYIEHITGIRLPVIYDVYLMYRQVYPRLHIRYRPANRWIVKVFSNYKFILKPPVTRTPWIPVVLVGIVGVTIGILIGFIITRKLSKGR